MSDENHYLTDDEIADDNSTVTTFSIELSVANRGVTPEERRAIVAAFKQLALQVQIRTGLMPSAHRLTVNAYYTSSTLGQTDIDFTA